MLIIIIHRGAHNWVAGTHARQKSGMGNATCVTTRLCVLDRSSSYTWHVAVRDVKKATDIQQHLWRFAASSNGEFTSDFVGLIELGADRTAQAITNGRVGLFQETGLDDWTTKLVAVCTDGPAVHVGCAKTPATCCGWRLPCAHSVHRTHTGELFKISWSQRSSLWDI